jgi:GTP-binding protein
MEIKKARFLVSNSKPDKCPSPNLPEYAFIGRSNVGKSSLINMITARSKLAKTSGKPGKTQLINHFLINDEWYLVDLPGYGYAKVSKTKRAGWQDFILEYLEKRANLLCLFVLIDIRIPPQEIDIDFLALLGELQVPFVLLLTKSEKLSSNKITSNINELEKAVLREWEEMPAYFLTSARSGRGKKEILDFIENTNASFIISDKNTSNPRN